MSRIAFKGTMDGRCCDAAMSNGHRDLMQRAHDVAGRVQPLDRRHLVMTYPKVSMVVRFASKVHGKGGLGAAPQKCINTVKLFCSPVCSTE